MRPCGLARPVVLEAWKKAFETIKSIGMLYERINLKDESVKRMLKYLECLLGYILLSL